MNVTLAEWECIISELQALDNKATLSGQEERHRVTLLAKASMLKQGISGDEARHATVSRLRKELGLPEPWIPEYAKVKNPRAVREWKNFLAKGEMRDTNLAGSQTISYTEGGSGGYLIPYGFDERQDVLMSQYSYDAIVRPEFCAEFETATGNPMSTPIVDDFTPSGSPVVYTVGASVILSEATQETQRSIKSAVVNWQDAPKFSSGVVVVPRELFDDAQYGIENAASLVEAVIARRHSIGLGRAMISGAGLTGGLTLNLPAGTKITSASSTLALTDWTSLYSTLPVWYRQGAVWYMHDNTRLALYNLLQTSGRTAVELPTQFMGLPIAICNDMNATAAGAANIVVLANPRYLMKRKAGSYIQMLTQRYADSGSIGFLGIMRADFATALYGSASAPVASMSQHA